MQTIISSSSIKRILIFDFKKEIITNDEYERYLKTDEAWYAFLKEKGLTKKEYYGSSTREDYQTRFSTRKPSAIVYLPNWITTAWEGDEKKEFLKISLTPEATKVYDFYKRHSDLF